MKIFQPDNDKDLRDKYPELNTYDEFKELSSKELLFVWYYSCKSSPYAGQKEEKRVLSCLGKVNDFLNDNDYEKYADLRFPERVAFAMQVMANFEPDLRKEAEDIHTHILSNLSKAAKIDIGLYEEISDKKDIIAMQVTIAKNLPDIVRAKEQGYGISKKQVKEEDNFFEKTF